MQSSERCTKKFMQDPVLYVNRNNVISGERLCVPSTYQVRHNFVNPTDSTINTVFCSFDNNTVTLRWSSRKAHSYTTKVFTDLPKNFTTSSNKMSMVAWVNTNLTLCLVLLQSDVTVLIKCLEYTEAKTTFNCNYLYSFELTLRFIQISIIVFSVTVYSSNNENK